MLPSRFSHQSVDIFVNTYFFYHNWCYGKGKTNILSKENYWKKHLSKHKNRIRRILCAPECFLNVTFCVKRFGFIGSLHVLYWFEYKQCKANSISLSIFYFHFSKGISRNMKGISSRKHYFKTKTFTSFI
jgi:hypothetical protein